MQRRIPSVVIKSLDFNIFFKLQEGDQLQMFAFIDEGEHPLAIFFELDCPFSDPL